MHLADLICGLFLNFPAEFSRRWCTLNDGVFSYYESDRNSTPNGALKASEIVCLAVDSPKKHGYTPKRTPAEGVGFVHVLLLQLPFLPTPRYNHTFEVYSERLYLFGTDDPESHKEWVNSIAKVSSPEVGAVASVRCAFPFSALGSMPFCSPLDDRTIHPSLTRASPALFPPFPQSFLPAAAEPLLRLNFERIGRLKYKGLNLQTSKVGWFALAGSTLHAYLSDSPRGEEIQLRKLNELCE